MIRESDMRDVDKTKEQLVQELTGLRQRVSELQNRWIEDQRAAASLRAREEQLRTFLNYTVVGIALVDPDGYFLDVNEPWCRAVGYTREELQHLALRDVISNADATGIIYSDHYGDGHRRLEKRFVHKDGREFWADLVVSRVSSGESPNGEITILTMNASQRQPSDEALHQHNRNLALLNQVSQLLIATLDLPQVLEKLLRAAIEITDAEGSSVWLWDEERPGELVCRAILLEGEFTSPGNLRLGPGEGIAGWVAQRGKSALVGNVRQDTRFFPGIDQKIDYRTTSLLAVPLKMRDQISGVLEVVNKRDAGSGKKATSFSTDDRLLVEMLAASAAIAIYNARLVEALRQYGMELETRNQELDAFAHSVAHDLKNPLGHIVGFAELLEESHTNLSDHERQQCLSTIAQTGRKMSNIIDELLLLAGVRKKDKVEMHPLDTTAVVNEALGRLADLTRKHGALINLPDDWPVAMGYGPWVEEIWVNYLSNAILYGGEPPRIQLGATEEPDGHIRFWVRDNGNGLTPEEQARLFTSFERLDRVRAKGHGLGLSIVRRIVEKLGGQVGVESQVGVGSVFSFSLPGVAPD
jgi:PAS domain S-box-containing protein